jgi:hypothetical protein
VEKKWEYSGTVPQLFIDFKQAYDSVWKELLYNILIEFGVPMKLVGQLCLDETVKSIQVEICLEFPIQNGMKQEDALLPLLLNFAI